MRPDPQPTPAPDPALVSESAAVQTSPRRRLARLVFVLSLTPGTVIVMVLAPAMRSPLLLATGLTLLVLALAMRHRLALWVLARTRRGPSLARPAAPAPSSEIP